MNSVFPLPASEFGYIFHWKRIKDIVRGGILL